MGLLLEELKENRNTLADYNKLLKKLPNNFPTKLLKSTLYKKDRNLKNVVNKYDKFLELQS